MYLLIVRRLSEMLIGLRHTALHSFAWLDTSEVTADANSACSVSTAVQVVQRGWPRHLRMRGC